MPDEDHAKLLQNALELYQREHRLANVALAHERLATVTTGKARAAHVQAAHVRRQNKAGSQ